MPQQSLGNRRGYMVRADVRAPFAEVAAEHGYSSVSRWLADIGYQAAGMDELMLGPDKETNDRQLRLPA